MKKKALIITGVAVLLIAAVWVIKKGNRSEAHVTFETVKVERAKISNTVTATGTIQAVRSVSVGTQVSGIIQKIYVDFNDHVKKGQLMAKLDETPNRSQLDQAQANLDQATAQLNYQKATFERLKVLYEKNLIAKADYDQALYNYENSKASVINATSGLTRARVNLDYCTITSPIEGVVLNRAVEEGQTVAASFNTPTLFTIVNDLTQMQVQTSVDEADIGKIKLGQRVEFSVDAYLDMKFEGKVSQIRLQPVTTNNVVTYVVILNAPNPEKKLMPGMTASATIFVEEKDNALIISGKALRFSPSSAYLEKMKGAYQNSGNDIKPVAEASGKNVPEKPVSGSRAVWIKGENESLHPVRITTGIDNGTSTEVLTGLSEGEEVIISMNDGTAKAATTSASSGRPGGPFPF